MLISMVGIQQVNTILDGWPEYPVVWLIVLFSFAEIIVLVMFVLLALLWITRNPVFVPGWGTLFLPK